MPVTQEIGSSIISCGTASHLATSAFINSLHGFPTPHWMQLVTYNTELFSYSVEPSLTCLICANAPKYALPTHCSCTIFSTVHVFYGHLGTNHKCPDYQGVLIFQVSLHDKAPFGTITLCVDYAGVYIFKCPDFSAWPEVF